jgi:hypothetical protein
MFPEIKRVTEDIQIRENASSPLRILMPEASPAGIFL